MLKLPFDILHLIFPKLVQRDLVECMTVCRHWYNIIHDHVLFQVIFLNNQQQIYRLISRVKEDPVLGKKVERIQIYPDYGFDSRILIDLFPNLLDFFVENLHTWGGNKPVVKPQQSHPWCKHIEKMVEEQPDVGIETVLHSGLCKNLVYISIKGCNEPLRGFVKLLVNAPFLKTLRLSTYFVSFDDLELLHNMVPLLCSLSLSGIDYDRSSFPPVIKPATTIKRFECTDGEFAFFDFSIPHLPYISQKYTQLESLVLQINPPHPRSQINPSFQEEEKEMLMLYFKTLRPHLKTFSIHTSNIDFNLLDQSGCKIESLGLNYSNSTTGLDQLAHTTQTQSIQSLTVGLICQSVDQPTLFGCLTHFTMLKDLTLSFFWNIISLTDILDFLCRTQLVTLQLHDLELKGDEANITKVYPFLKNLTLFNVRFGKGTDTLISRAFPNLKNLKMSHCFNEKESFMLPHTNLLHLEIRNKSVNDNFPILLITVSDGQQRLYNAGATLTGAPYSRDDWETDKFAIPYISSKLYNASVDIPSLTVVCNSVYNFTMNIGLSFNIMTL